MERIRVTLLTSAALSSIISGAFITAAAMTNFPQAVLFGLLLFVVLELGTWWTIHCVKVRNRPTTPFARLSLAASIIVIGLGGYSSPRSFLWALFAVVATKMRDGLSRNGSTGTSNQDLLQVLASIVIIEIAMRDGLDIFIRLAAMVLGRTESERHVARLLFQESVMFDNRFMAQWLGVVTGLQLVGRVILHLRL